MINTHLLKIVRSAAVAPLALLIMSVPEASAQSPAGSKDKASIVARGEYLAQAGDCVACHTAPEGKLFAGGRAMPTPFGTLYTSNITPDPETGVGKWTADQFYTNAHRPFARRPAALSGDAVRLLYEGHASRQRRHLRVHAVGRPRQAAEQAA